MKHFPCIILLIFFSTILIASPEPDIIVAKDNSGNYQTLTEAINSLPYFNYQRITIYVKNGVYNEKIKIDCDYITIIGESRDSTIIEYAQLREDWQKNKDNIGPAVININADDIILKNLTIKNTQPQIGPHAFTILGTGTRTIITNCNVTSNGGDTVSLWDYKTGMYYHDNCYFEGAVDFVCPRGWCYISNSTFKELKNTAAIWHAGSGNKNQKFVLNNCIFTSTDSFYLARHHYDAQFYFLNCQFSDKMRNKQIERVTYPQNIKRNRPYLYGDRYYFNNCNREKGNYQWFINNFDSITQAKSITPKWTFDKQWNPIDTSQLKIAKIEYLGNSVFLWFNEVVMPTGNLKVTTDTSQQYSYYSGAGTKRLEFRANSANRERARKGEKIQVISGNIMNIKATVIPRYYISPK